MRITNKEQLAAHGNREGRKIVAELLDAGLDALDPYVRVKQLVHVENGKIVLHTDGFEMKGDPHAGPLEFDLKDYDRVYVVGAAKGVQRAALAREEALGDVLTGRPCHCQARRGHHLQKIRRTLAGHLSRTRPASRAAGKSKRWRGISPAAIWSSPSREAAAAR